MRPCFPRSAFIKLNYKLFVVNGTPQHYWYSYIYRFVYAVRRFLSARQTRLKLDIIEV